MRVCPLCDAKFPHEATFCWFDGSKLIEPSESSHGTEKVGSPETETPEPALSLDSSLEHLENDPEFIKAQEEANAARLAAEEAMKAAQQADQLAQEAAQKARERAEEKAAAAKAALEEARAKAQERLEEANRVEQERLQLEAEIEAAKQAEQQAMREAEEAELAKQAEEEAEQQARERAKAAADAAAAAKAAEEQAIAAAQAAAEMAREAEEMARAVQEEAQRAQEAKEAAKQAEEAARERVANECQTTQVLEQAALEKAIAEKEARKAAQEALQAVEQGVVPEPVLTLKTEGADSVKAQSEIEAATAKAEQEEAAAKAEQEEAAAKAEQAETTEQPESPTIHLPANDWEGQTLRQYNILKYLGTGSQGDVFLAKHNNTGARVALKILNEKTCQHPKRVARFFELLEKASGLEHPGLIHIHETVHELDAPSFYVMDALNGAPLSSYRPQQMDICLEIASQLAKAVAKAHASDILHGQLNMENIYLLANAQGKRRVSVLDFGAHSLHSDRDELSIHDDMSSLGRILEQLFAQFEEKPEELLRVIEVCLNSEKQEKPKTADDIAKTLEWIARQRPVAKKLSPAAELENNAPVLDETDDDDDDFEIMQWKKKSAARKRKIVFSAMTMILAVAAIAYGTQQRWDDAIDNLSTSLTPEKVEEKATEGKPQAKTEPASVKANKKTRVETAGLKPEKRRVAPKPKVVKAKPAPVKKVEPIKAEVTKPVVAKPASVPAPVAIKPPSPPPAPMLVEFQSEPVGARVRRVADKKVVGVTPFTLQLPSDSKSEAYEFSLPGYESVSQQWNPNKSSRVLATLKVQKVEATPAPQPKVSQPPAKVKEASTNTHEDLVDPFAQEG